MTYEQDSSTNQNQLYDKLAWGIAHRRACDDLFTSLTDVVGQMEKEWREEVGLVTGSLRKKLVNFYVDAVDGYDDTTA